MSSFAGVWREEGSVPLTVLSVILALTRAEGPFVDGIQVGNASSSLPGLSVLGGSPQREPRTKAWGSAGIGEGPGGGGVQDGTEDTRQREGTQTSLSPGRPMPWEPVRAP